MCSTAASPIVRSPTSTVEDVLQRDPEVNVIFGYDAENGLGAIAALEASGRGQAENNVCKTEMVVSVDGSTDEILKVMDPNSSYGLTLALRPSENARACVDMMLKVINGEIDMYDTTQNVKIPSFVIDCWNMDIASTEQFMLEEWRSRSTSRPSWACKAGGVPETRQGKPRFPWRC